MIEVALHVKITTPDGIVKTGCTKRSLLGSSVTVSELIADAEETVLDVLDMANVGAEPPHFLFDDVAFIDKESE